MPTLLIDSRERLPGSTTARARFHLNEPILGCKRVTLHWASFVNQFSNGGGPESKTLIVLFNGLGYPVNLFEKHYTGAELAISTNTALQNHNAAWSCTYSATTNLLTFNLPGGAAISPTQGVIDIWGASAAQENGVQLTGTFSTTPFLLSPQAVIFTSPQWSGHDEMRYATNDSMGADKRRHSTGLVVPVFAGFQSSNFYSPAFKQSLDFGTPVSLDTFELNIFDEKGLDVNGMGEYIIQFSIQ